jgi:hypothetical protein
MEVNPTYEAPQMEAIEMEVEDAILNDSLNSIPQNGSWGSN